MDIGRPRPCRRSLRLAGLDYRQTGGYFVTVCAADMRCVFGRAMNRGVALNELGRAVESCWLEIPRHFAGACVDEFVVMPNHVHGIIFIADEEDRATHASPLRQIPEGAATDARKRASGPAGGSLGAVVGSFKAAATRATRRIAKNPRLTIWQRNYHEHVIRNESDLLEIRRYIVSNPSQWESDRNNPGRPHTWKSLLAEARRGG